VRRPHDRTDPLCSYWRFYAAINERAASSYEKLDRRGDHPRVTMIREASTSEARFHRGILLFVSTATDKMIPTRSARLTSRQVGKRSVIHIRYLDRRPSWVDTAGIAAMVRWRCLLRWPMPKQAVRENKSGVAAESGKASCQKPKANTPSNCSGKARMTPARKRWLTGMTT
jgi:hypothetical protein